MKDCKFCLYQKYDFKLKKVIKCKICSLTGKECVEKCKEFDARPKT